MGEPTSFGCASCFQCEATQAWEHRASLRLVARLIDESHFSVSVLACPDCGQPFVSIFAETIDWSDGDDPQEWLLLPVAADEATELQSQGERLSLAEVERLGASRRHLDADFPKGGAQRIEWRAGGLLLPDHD
ncbi:MAG: hypothetical protein HY906_15940 [Deltaproteobacteria bacterium]|nr:hypothetical protein [Deltaproteobacteria bacterium]